jgi:anti-sigma-K factor RskA
MIDDELLAQAALYALGALTPDEAAVFRAKLPTVPGLAEIVAEYEEAATVVAEAAPPSTPPAALRESILASISKKPRVVESHRIVWVPWALAAGFAFVAGALWVENQRLTIENRGQRTAWTDVNRQLATMNESSAEKDLLTGTLRKRIDELVRRNSLTEMQVATLTSKLDGSYLASIAWDNSSQEGVLHVRRLPAAGDGKDYQLWVIDPKNAAPVSAGIFTVQADGSATIRFSPAQKVSAASAFAVSVEKTGGSAAPEGPVVLSN